MIGIKLQGGTYNNIDVIESLGGSLYDITDKSEVSNNTVKRLEPINGTSSVRDLTIKPISTSSLENNYNVDDARKVPTSKAVYDMYYYLVDLITNNKNPYMFYYNADFKAGQAVATDNIDSLSIDPSDVTYYKLTEDPLDPSGVIVKDILDSTSAVTVTSEYFSDVGDLFFDKVKFSDLGIANTYFPWVVYGLKINRPAETGILFKIHFTVKHEIDPTNDRVGDVNDFMYIYPVIHRVVAEGGELTHHNRLFNPDNTTVYEDADEYKNQSFIYQDFATDIQCKVDYSDTSIILNYYSSFYIDHTHPIPPQEYIILGLGCRTYYDSAKSAPTVIEPKVNVLFEFIKQIV